jgi:hypothetical protein
MPAASRSIPMNATVVRLAVKPAPNALRLEASRSLPCRLRDGRMKDMTSLGDVDRAILGMIIFRLLYLRVTPLRYVVTDTRAIFYRY